MNNEEAELKLRRKLVIKPLIYLIITIIIFIISLINVRRLVLFSFLIFNNTVLIPFALFITIILFVGVECVIFYVFNAKDRNIAIKINDIADIPRFVDFILMISLFLVVFVITPCNVSGPSMADTLHDGNKIVCSDLFYTPKCDDIVIFDSSNYTETKTELYIKRIVAKEGQKVEFKNLALYVDDQLVCENLTKFEYDILYTTNFGVGVTEVSENSYVVAKDKYIVLGDNRNVSYDSRKFGEIDRKDIYGRVLFRFYPFSEIKKEIRN